MNASVILEDLIKTKTTLNNRQIAEGLSFFKSVLVKRNEILLEQGDVADKLYFIVRGCLRIYYSNEEHGMSTRFMAFENTFLTSIVSFISREPATEYIQAVEETELLSISHVDFSSLRQDMPEWDKIYIHILEYGLTVINSRLGGLLTQTAVQRYRDLLRDNPELIQRLSNSNLASYLNVSPETLSRLKSQM